MKTILFLSALTLFSGCATEEPANHLTFLSRHQTEQEPYKDWPEPYKSYMKSEDEYYRDIALANEHLPPQTNQEQDLGAIRRTQEEIKRELGWQELEINQLRNGY